MDIAALSVVAHQAGLMQKVGTAVLKKAMNTAEDNSDSMIKMMEQSVKPYLGTNLDLKA